MPKYLTAATLVSLAALACSVERGSSDGPVSSSTEQELNTCGLPGLEWKPYLARMAYDAAEDFGRWEFTTDLKISGDRLVISKTGYERCSNRGRSGCPSMSAALSVQEGEGEVHNEQGRVIINPNTIRTQLVNGFMAQAMNETYEGSLSDHSEVSPYHTFRSASRTGLPHTLSLTNCAATVYRDNDYGGSSQCLRTGSYRAVDLKIGDNRISSIKVRSGMRVTLYTDDAFAGSSMELMGDASSLSNVGDQVSSIVITQDWVCSSVDSFQVNGAGADWHKIRGKLVTLGYLRGNDLLDVRLDVANNVVDVDPFNVDFIPPSQIGGSIYGVKVKSPTAETWRSTEDPAPAIFPVGSACKKQPYGSYSWFLGTVRSVGSYRYCYLK